jgi:hypothetical protein
MGEAQCFREGFGPYWFVVPRGDMDGQTAWVGPRSGPSLAPDNRATVLQAVHVYSA